MFIFNIYLFILAFIIFAYLDYKRKNTIIFYDIDEETELKLQQFYDSFDEITKCKRKWYILSKNYNFDAKYNSGASSLVNRKDIIIANKSPKYIKTNVKIPCVPVGKQKLYFFPDKVLIIEGKKVGALSYKNLGISVTNGNFIETEMKPWDGTVVDYTYKYVNKSGGPDRRFANNPRYPIMSYSYINFYGDNGFNECIMLSKQGVGNILKEQIRALQSKKILEKDSSINENKTDKLNDINEVINNTEKFKNEEINIKIENSDENILEEYEDNEIDPRGIISGNQESKPRKVLMTKERWMQLKNNDIKNKEVDNSAVEENKEEINEDIEEKTEEQIEIKDKKKNMFYKK